MSKILCAVFDKKAKAYGPIMSYAHEAQAIRDFGQACQNPELMIAKYPADFELRNVGVFHDTMADTTHEPILDEDVRVIITADAYLAAQSSGPQLAREA